MYAWARIETQENTCQVGEGGGERREWVKGRLFFQVPSATKKCIKY